MRLKGFAVAAVCLLLLAACGQKPDTAAAQPDGGTSPETAQQPDTPDIPDTDDTPDTPRRFLHDEIMDTLSMTEEQLTALFGKPLNRVESQGAGQTYAILHYDGADAQMGPDYMVQLNVTVDLLPAPRGIKIGDTVETVLANFPDDGDQTFYEEQGGPGLTYRQVYGEYVNMSPYGVARYENGVLYRFDLAESGYGLTFYFTDGVLSEVEYQITV